MAKANAADLVWIGGSGDPAFTVTYSGFVNSETPKVLDGTLALSRGPDQNVGSYPITPAGLTSANYAIVFNSGALAVTRAPLSITADAKTKTYGAADPVFTATYGGFVNGDTSAALGGTMAFARASGESGGGFLITPSGLTSGNFSITFNTGSVTISAPAPSILSLALPGPDSIALTWSAVSNATYRVQYKSDLNATNWTDLAGDISATNTTASKTDVRATPRRFYRIEVIP